MAQTIKLPNFNSQNVVDQTVLTADQEAGSALLAVENSDSFTEGAYAFVGQFGEESPDFVAVIEQTSETSVTTDPLDFAHVSGTPAYVLFGNELSIYRAPNVNGTAPAANQFSLVESVLLNLDDTVTVYTDDTGGADWWYRFTYKGDNGETAIEDCPAVRGGNSQIYCSTDAIRQAAGFENAKYVTDQMIVPHRTSAQSKIDGTLSGRYEVPFSDPINPQIQTIATQLAAGYLLKDQYPNSPDRGNAKITWAEGELTKIVEGEIVLLNAVGVNQELPENENGSGYPDETTQYEDGEDRLFKISDVRNNFDRKY